jgi:subtilisin family serine protease
MRAAARLVSVAAGVLLVASSLPAWAAVNDPGFSDQWALPKIGAPQAWSRADGGGIIIAVVDTGVDLNHEDLAGKLVQGRDFVAPDTPPNDEHGHGTHVAGIAAAITNNGRGIAGVAPEARIMPVRVLDHEGSGSASNVAAGIRWAADNGAHIINLSLGSLDQPLFGPSFGAALDYAWSNGSTPIVAAGNLFVAWAVYD